MRLPASISIDENPRGAGNRLASCILQGHTLNRQLDDVRREGSVPASCFQLNQDNSVASPVGSIEPGHKCKAHRFEGRLGVRQLGTEVFGWESLLAGTPIASPREQKQRARRKQHDYEQSDPISQFPPPVRHALARAANRPAKRRSGRRMANGSRRRPNWRQSQGENL
ncbi:MAG: hypothetical protein ABI589_02580 [Burkholderiales bacterium]